MRKVNLTVIIEPIMDIEDLADLDIDNCIVCGRFADPFKDKIYIVSTPFERLPLHGKCLEKFISRVNEWNKLYSD